MPTKTVYNYLCYLIFIYPGQSGGGGIDVRELAKEMCRVVACAPMVVIYSGCGFDSRLVDFLYPPSPVNQPVADIHAQYILDYTRGDEYVYLHPKKRGSIDPYSRGDEGQDGGDEIDADIWHGEK